MGKIRFGTNPRVLHIIILGLMASLLFSGYLFLYNPVTTIILVRHAEKNSEPNNPNPTLSPAGQERAQELTRVLGKAGITSIFATQYLRTQQTVQPLADRLSLPVNRLDSGNTAEVVRQIKRSHAGGVVFVAGHSNTVPAIIAGLGGANYPVISESEYDNMFIVTVYRFRKAKVVKLKYGSPVPLSADRQTMNK